MWGVTGVAVAASLAGSLGLVVAFRTFIAESGTRLRDLRPGRRELRDYAAHRRVARRQGPAPLVTLLVQAPPGYEAERRYVLDVVLSDWLGLDWRLRTEERSDVRIGLEGEPSGPSVVLPDVLFATSPDEWLTAASLPSMPLASGTVADGLGALARGGRMPVLYGSPTAGPLLSSDPHGARLEVDVFGSAFFMLSRYEEVVVADRDRYGRFPASSSLAARAGFLRWPVVDAYVELLWSALERAVAAARAPSPGLRGDRQRTTSTTRWPRSAAARG